MTLFYLATGQVSELKISRNYENILFTSGQSHSLEIGGVVSEAFGEALGSTVLSSSSAGAELEMDFFSCSVYGEIISGRFYKVEFKDGQHIDFAVKVESGQRDVQAARDPLRRLVWTLPYRTKGHLAQRESNFVGSFATSICFAMVLSVAIIFADHEPGYLPLEVAGYGAFLGFFLMLIVSYRVCRKVFRTSWQATEAFKVLGFADPANLDLPRGHRKAERRYAAETGESEAEDRPWCFRHNASDMENSAARAATKKT